MTSDYTELEIQEQMSDTDGYEWALKTIQELQKKRTNVRRHNARLRKQLAGMLSLLALHGIDLEGL